MNREQLIAFHAKFMDQSHSFLKYWSLNRSSSIGFLIHSKEKRIERLGDKVCIDKSTLFLIDFFLISPPFEALSTFCLKVHMFHYSYGDTCSLYVMSFYQIFNAITIDRERQIHIWFRSHRKGKMRFMIVENTYEVGVFFSRGWQ